MVEVDISQLAINRQTKDQRFSPRKHLLTRYLIPGAILLGFFGLIVWSSWDYLDPPTEVKVTPVITSKTATRQEGTTLFNAAGWIEPRPTAIRVAALAPGVVEKLLVVEDQPVTQGQPVAELIREDALLAYNRSIADRELAEAELEKESAALIAAKTKYDQPVHLEAKLAKADADLAKVQTMLKNLNFETDRAQSRLDLAVKNHQRNIDAGASVSQREKDETQTARDTARALVRELIERRESLVNEEQALIAQKHATQTQLDLLADEIQAKDEAIALVNAAKAKLAQRRVAEAEAKLRLARMTIRAPVTGRVYQLVGLPGSRIGMGLTAGDSHDASSVVTMYQPHSLQIRVDVRFEDIPKVSLNQSVLINNPAIQTPLQGKVLFISSEADIQKNTLQVKVSIEQVSDFFKPEMLVDVTFLAPKPKPSVNLKNEATLIFLPRKFVQSSPNGDYVWVADRSERIARKISVNTAVSTGPILQITRGLTIDSRVISSGFEKLQEGDRIRITGEDPENKNISTPAMIDKKS